MDESLEDVCRRVLPLGGESVCALCGVDAAEREILAALATVRATIAQASANLDVMLAGSEVAILDNLPDDGATHTAGTVRFAPDGTLFVGNGDGSADGLLLDPAFRLQLGLAALLDFLLDLRHGAEHLLLGGRGGEAEEHLFVSL